MSKQYVIKNAKVEHVFNQKAREKFGKAKREDGSIDKEYTINVAVTDKDIANLEELGVTEQVINPKTKKLQSRYKTNETLGKYIVLKKNELKKDGTPNQPPLALDTKGNTLTQRVGNGSIAHVGVWISDNGSPKFDDLVVVDLVEAPKGDRMSKFDGLIDKDNDIQDSLDSLQAEL